MRNGQFINANGTIQVIALAQSGLAAIGVRDARLAGRKYLSEERLSDLKHGRRPHTWAAACCPETDSSARMPASWRNAIPTSRVNSRLSVSVIRPVTVFSTGS